MKVAHGLRSWASRWGKPCVLLENSACSASAGPGVELPFRLGTFEESFLGKTPLDPQLGAVLEDAVRSAGDR